VEAALRSTQPREIPEAVKTRLLANVGPDVVDLLPHLRTRADGVAERLRAALAARGEKEAREMVEILQSQRTRIETAFAKTADPQLTLEWDDESRRQLEADRRHWQKRLHALEGEIIREPARIRAGYDIKANRVEPVGIVYLWPVSG
jgi:hypothetical protein